MEGRSKDIDDPRLGPDDPLRALFQEAGRHAAPPDLESRVVVRLAEKPVQAVHPAPLIPKRGWWAVAAIMAALAMAAWWVPGTSGQVSPLNGTLLSGLQAGLAMLSSPWSFAALLGLAGVLAGDRWTGHALQPVGRS